MGAGEESRERWKDQEMSKWRKKFKRETERRSTERI